MISYSICLSLTCLHLVWECLVPSMMERPSFYPSLSFVASLKQPFSFILHTFLSHVHFPIFISFPPHVYFFILHTHTLIFLPLSYAHLPPLPPHIASLTGMSLPSLRDPNLLKPPHFYPLLTLAPDPLPLAFPRLSGCCLRWPGLLWLPAEFGATYLS